MAEVTGTIGNEYVELNNAATEATLRLLLQSNLAANKQSIDNIKNLAQRSGLDPATVAAANQGMRQTSEATNRLKSSWAGLNSGADTLTETFRDVDATLGKLINGTAEASDLLSHFAKMGGVVGLLGLAFQRAAQFQEKNLEVYQKISSAGINFTGSLTDMRMAASNAYLTLEQFGNLIKANSEAFAMMGGTADQGARAFLKFSNSLLNSKEGDQLRALGYTSEQVNQSMVSYIAMTGGRNKQEMQDTKALSSAAVEYMTQLDSLAQITGKSRESQEAALKEEAANQAYQAYLLTLDGEGKKKANAALAIALATGGKGAAQALQSQLLGLPPMTKAAQEFTAIAPRMAAANNEMAATVKDAGKYVADTNKAGDKLRVAATQTSKDLGDTGKAVIMGGGTFSGTMSTIQGITNRNAQQNIQNEADAEKQRQDIAEQQKIRQASEADAAAKTQQAVFKLGNELLESLLPAIRFLTNIINPLIGFLLEFTQELKNSPNALKALGVAIVALMASMAIRKTAAVARGAAGAGTSLASMAGLTGVLGTKSNPMFVTIVDDLVGGGRRGGRAPGGGGRAPGSSALKAAGSALKVGGVVGGLASAGMLYSDLSDIEDQQTAGTITAEEAKTAKGGAVGSAGGGLAGGLAGAAAGAAVGSIVPVVGTIIGGLVGGAIGAFGGSSLGKMAGESLTSTPKVPPSPTALPPISDETLKKMKEITLPVTGTPSAVNNKESILGQLDILNKQTAEVLRYLKETAEYTKRNYNATRDLSGNLFPSP